MNKYGQVSTRDDAVVKVGNEGWSDGRGWGDVLVGVDDGPELRLPYQRALRLAQLLTRAAEGGLRDLPADAVCRVPLYRKDGSVRAFALVDAEDFEAVSRYRWAMKAGGYPSRYAGGMRYVLMYRELMGLADGDPRVVDHINGNPLDNRRANLRVCTQAQNAQNRVGQGSTSPFRGVCWNTAMAKWAAYAVVDGKQHNLGHFPTEDEAAAAARAFRSEHMPFANEERAG